MSRKFEKNRSVSPHYCKCPLYYTGIKDPRKIGKELVLPERLGENYTACWRNNRLCKTGIEFLLPVTKEGFLFKGKEIKLQDCKKVF